MVKTFQWSFAKFLAASFAFAIVLASGAIYSFDSLQGAISKTNNNPTGSVDFVVTTNGRCTIDGTAYDPNSANGGKAAITVAIYYKEAVSGIFKGVGSTVANTSRPDLAPLLGNNNINHGYSYSFPAEHWNSGREYYVFGINVGAGSNQLLGSMIRPVCTAATPPPPVVVTPPATTPPPAVVTPPATVTPTPSPTSILQVMYPNGGEQVFQSDPITFRWRLENVPTNALVNLAVTMPNGEVIPFNSVPNTGVYQAFVPRNSNQGGYAKFAVSYGNMRDESDGSFEIKPRFIQVTSPVGGENYLAGQNVEFKWQSVAVPTTETVSLSMANFQTGLAPGPYTTIATAVANNGTFTWKIPANTVAGQYKFFITGSSNIWKDVSPNPFTVSTPPLIPAGLNIFSYSNCINQERMSAINGLMGKAGASPYDYNNNGLIDDGDVTYAKKILCPSLTWNTQSNPTPINCITPLDFKMFELNFGKRGWMDTNGDGTTDGSDLVKLGNLICTNNIIGPIPL